MLACGAATVRFTALPGVVENNVYLGFSAATVDGFPLQQLLCDDFEHTTYMPSGDLAYQVAYLDGADPVHGARFASAGSPAPADFTRYREAAVLVAALVAAGPAASSDTVADYQYAIWSLFDPAKVTLTRPVAQQALIDSAAATVHGGGAQLGAVYSSLRIYTPDRTVGSNQEFLQYVGGLAEYTTSTPEPSQSLTLLAALAAGVTVLRRRRL